MKEELTLQRTDILDETVKNTINRGLEEYLDEFDMYSPYTYVIKENGIPKAVVKFYEEKENEVYIEQLEVFEKFRDTGIGKKFIRHLKKNCGIKIISGVSTYMSIGFWQKQGAVFPPGGEIDDINKAISLGERYTKKYRKNHPEYSGSDLEKEDEELYEENWEKTICFYID